MTDYIVYFRVSTDKQGRSGLGLAAQAKTISSYLKLEDRVVGEFTEIGSGRVDHRTELWKAINAAKKSQARLLIAKLDRFSRKVSFISSILDQGIRLEVAELPNATEFQLHIFAALAQEERRLISERTRQALAEAKLRGRKLGSNGINLANRNREMADAYCEKVGSIVSSLYQDHKSYRRVAKELNKLGIKTPRERKFHAEQVKNILLRVESTPTLSKAVSN